MSRPYAMEEDVLVLCEKNGKKKYLMVYQTEDIQYEDRSTWAGTAAKACATATLSTPTQMSNLEPEDHPDPEVEIYQLRVGVRGPCMVYAQLNYGEGRRGTWRQPLPSSSNYFVGHINQMQSPLDDPKFELFCIHGQYPAFSVYNPTAMRKAETILGFIGKKLRCYDLEMDRTPGLIGIAPAQVQNILQRLKAGNYPHRAVTLRGLS